MLFYYTRTLVLVIVTTTDFVFRKNTKEYIRRKCIFNNHFVSNIITIEIVTFSAVD